ncbi:MAG: tRNA (guanosine(37)-N1)-methyltransferase TrmD [Firmicutes bacterium]|nr:tRNA (guanosine(37)-N1)-methyltransferase TrmD [Bacillota bacterium]MBQ2270300.1 tRNA (guanosine(37)-N1)-methyltransferase TrmD [Bacillota bacterium]MBQ5797743.1 tRNA (guanosine(37)-N1)-methyltransferase TrmD [Bacillota bacterium]MBR5000400.1 tRNA (guanosine(37)-N1)-methyltransferase TrmD [Bacillota bacterium]MBR6500360.1 tRNA (guanosine(37)-N1)-methyltransferase TrmD [Bacillota bacterium]
MRINVLTLFPQMFRPVTEDSIVGRANQSGILDIRCVNIRDYTQDKHKRTDDTPFGGGAGMVMFADPIFRAMEDLGAVKASGEAAAAGGKKQKMLYMSPRGKILDQAMIEDLAKQDELFILCGHYEGVDQRVLDYWEMEEVSIGDYILTGGELPAMVLIDTVARMVPEVLGNGESHLEESIYSGLLEYPHYTKPREYCGMETPEVLLSGNHKNIHMWRLEQSLRLTKERRPDLWAKYLKDTSHLTKQEKKLLQSIIDEENR